MRTISIEKPSGTFFKTCEPQNRTVSDIVFDLVLWKANIRESNSLVFDFWKSHFHFCSCRLTCSFLNFLNLLKHEMPKNQCNGHGKLDINSFHNSHFSFKKS